MFFFKGALIGSWLSAPCHCLVTALCIQSCVSYLSRVMQRAVFLHVCTHFFETPSTTLDTPVRIGLRKHTYTYSGILFSSPVVWLVDESGGWCVGCCFVFLQPTAVEFSQTKARTADIFLFIGGCSTGRCFAFLQPRVLVKPTHVLVFSGGGGVQALGWSIAALLFLWQPSVWKQMKKQKNERANARVTHGR